MQHEITARQQLLDKNGNIAEPGFEKKLQEISAGGIVPEVLQEGFAEMPEV